MSRRRAFALIEACLAVLGVTFIFFCIWSGTHPKLQPPASTFGNCSISYHDPDSGRWATRRALVDPLTVGISGRTYFMLEDGRDVIAVGDVTVVLDKGTRP